jgi:hypothetical protein
LVATTPSEYERGTQWLRDLQPSPTIHGPPDSDEEHILVTDDDGTLVGVIVKSKRAVGVIVKSKRATLAAEAAEKLKKT